MPRDGSDVYHIPPGTEGIPDTTIESNKYNSFIHDVEQDLNSPRPIIAGGTGSTSASEALTELGGEKSSQLVTNYDSQVWYPGSFYSAANATASPVAGHAFVGWAVSSDPPVDPPTNANVVIFARDQNDNTTPGRQYVRQKQAGVWGLWSMDGTGLAGPTPPVNVPDNTLWWDSQSGSLFVYYDDGNSKQWVIASPQPDVGQFLLKTGDTMLGNLGLASTPVAAMDAANKKYVDDGVGSIVIPPAFPAGTRLLFQQAAAPTFWTKVTTFNDVGIRIVSGTPGAGATAGVPWSTVFSQVKTFQHTLTANEQASMSVGGSFSGSGTDQSGRPIVTHDDGNPSLGYTSGVGPGNPGMSSSYVIVGGSISGTASGGSQPHDHPISLNLSYVDVILASKD
jgi:hypothetical protein